MAYEMRDDMYALSKMPYADLNNRLIKTAITALQDTPHGVDIKHKRFLIVSALAKQAAREELRNAEEVEIVRNLITFIMAGIE